MGCQSNGAVELAFLSFFIGPVKINELERGRSWGMVRGRGRGRERERERGR